MRVTTTDGPRLVAMPLARCHAPEEPPSEVDRRLAAAVADVLATTADDVLTTDPLVLPLALSLCMQRHAVGPTGLVDVLRRLRAAVVAISGLDRASEPVPLGAGEPRVAAVRMAEHLHSMIGRSAGRLAMERETLARAAALQIRSA